MAFCFELLEHGYMLQRQQYLITSRLERKCQIGFRIRRHSLGSVPGTEHIPCVAQSTMRLPLNNSATNMPIHQSHSPALPRLDTALVAEPRRQQVQV
jgi:hypothetical protein